MDRGPDEDLTTGPRCGDPGSVPVADFKDLVAGEAPGLFRYALSLVGDQSTAEDLVSATVVRALEHEEQFRSDASLRTWVHRILTNLAIDTGRHGSHEVRVADVEALWRKDSYSVDPAVVVERAQSQDVVRDALVHLPYGYRSVVVLHDAEGWASREIANVLDISLPATKQRLRRGRMMLVSALSKETERHAANKGVPLSCWDARQKVSEYLDDELTSTDRALLETHLATCATCPPLYHALVSATSALGALHDPDSVIPDDLAQRIREGTQPASGRAGVPAEPRDPLDAG